jgi:alpha-L-rhamnosidase
MPGGGLTSAVAVHDSPYGRIESSWSTVGDQTRVVVTVPPNSEADVELPDGSRRSLRAGTTVFLVERRLR